MATLFLHIGHGKTGTSWIQTCLRLNRESLANHGIIYARGEDWLIDKPNIITSGNAQNLFKSKINFETILDNNRLTTGKALLFSSEHIFMDLIRANADEFIEKVAFAKGFDKIKILLFIRNPISSAVSVLQQRTKRRGNTEVLLTNLHENVEICSNRVYYIENILNRFEKFNSIELTVRNYSRCKDQLLNELALWLEVPEEIFQKPVVSRINRSMTYSELMLQKELNRFLGSSGNLLSDPLCEELPDIEPDIILPPLFVQEAIWKQVQPAIERINKRLPEAHRYQCDIRQPDALPETLTFNQRQIEVIAESLGKEILSLRNQIENAEKNISAFKEENFALKTKLENPFDGTTTFALIKQILKRIKLSISK